MKNPDTTQKQAKYIEFDDFVVESTSRIEAPRIVEQLKRISELKLENFIKLSGTKFEKTVQEMFSIIKNLEGHLRDVIAMNATLRVESQDSARESEKLGGEKEGLEQKLAGLQRDTPLVEDLEKKLALTLEELDRLRRLNRLEKEKLDQIEKDHRLLARQKDKIKEERDDAYREIVVLENQTQSMTKAKK